MARKPGGGRWGRIQVPAEGWGPRPFRGTVITSTSVGGSVSPGVRPSVIVLTVLFGSVKDRLRINVINITLLVLLIVC